MTNPIPSKLSISDGKSEQIDAEKKLKLAHGYLYSKEKKYEHPQLLKLFEEIIKDPLASVECQRNAKLHQAFLKINKKELEEIISQFPNSYEAIAAEYYLARTSETPLKAGNLFQSIFNKTKAIVWSNQFPLGTERPELIPMSSALQLAKILYNENKKDLSKISELLEFVIEKENYQSVGIKKEQAQAYLLMGKIKKEQNLIPKALTLFFAAFSLGDETTQKEIESAISQIQKEEAAHQNIIQYYLLLIAEKKNQVITKQKEWPSKNLSLHDFFSILLETKSEFENPIKVNIIFHWVKNDHCLDDYLPKYSKEKKSQIETLGELCFLASSRSEGPIVSVFKPVNFKLLKSVPKESSSYVLALKQLMIISYETALDEYREKEEFKGTCKTQAFESILPYQLEFIDLQNLERLQPFKNPFFDEIAEWIEQRRLDAKNQKKRKEPEYDTD